MSRIRLRLRRSPALRVDMQGLTPDRLGTLSSDEIAALELAAGKRLYRLAELFEIEVEAEDGEHLLEVHEPDGRIDGAGAGMRSGRMAVLGDAGAFAGQAMAGGRLHVRGACGAFAAAGMSGGELWVDDHAGDFLGAAPAGERRGMAGGTVVIGGRAGDRVAEQMRRGLIVVKGDVGRSCGARMIAGTVVVRGAAGAGIGRGMRRGTLLLGTAPAHVPATFADNGVQSLGIVAFLERHLAALTGEHTTSPGRVRRWVGDRANGGQGEILAPA